MAFAALTIDLNARMASFEEGLRRMEANAKASSSRLESAFGGLGSALKALGGVLSVGVLASFARDSLASASALDDMAEATGGTVEGLSKLVDIARISGGGIETVQTTIAALNKSLANPAADENKGVGAALQAIGLRAEDLLRLAPEKRVEAVAAALARFENDAAKANIVWTLFKQRSEQVVPYLNDVAENLERTGSLTAQQAADAEKLEKAWGGLAVEAQNLGRNIVTSLAPGLTDLIQQFTEGRRIAGGFFEALKLFGLKTGTGAPLEEMGKLEELRAKLEKAQSGKDDPRVQAARAQRIAEIDKQIEFLHLLQTQANRAALAGFDDQPKAPGKKATFNPLAGGGGGRSQAGFDPLDETIRLARLAQDELEDLARASEAATDQRLDDAQRLSRQVEDEFRLIEKYRELTKDPLGDFIAMNEDAWEASDGLASVAQELGMTFSSAFEDAILKGEKFSDVLKGIAQDILRIIARKTVTEPIAGAITSVLSNIKLFHGGGIVGLEGASARSLPALAFAAAPRFHSGLMPGEFPAILKEGEGVFTPQQMRALGSAGQPVSITLNVATGVQSTVRAEMLNLLPTIQKATVAAVADARLRGAAV